MPEPETQRSPTAARHPTLTASGFSKRYGSVAALTDASFTVSAGEVVALIGPNGSGKSTLLDAVAGQLMAEAGIVEVDGHPIGRDRRWNALFYLPDGIRPWPDQTADWVLRMCTGLFGGSDDARHMAVERLSLRPFLKARMGTLSKGEHRRVMLAIAIATPQPILLLDEPFDGLDLRQTRDVMALLRDCAAAGRGLFVSIHQLNDASRVADRLVLLSGGRVVGSGTLTELRVAADRPTGGLEEIFLALT